MRRAALLFMLSWASPGLQAAPEPSIQAEVEPNQARLGDVLTLTVRLTYPNGFSPEPPAIASAMGPFEVRRSSPLPVTVSGEVSIAPYQVELQAFTTGVLQLPAIEAAVRDMLGGRIALKTPELAVTIQPLPPDPKSNGDIRGIKAALGPAAWSPWWWLLLAAALLGAGLFFWRRRQRQIQGPPPPPPVPADEEALARLGELAASGWLDAGKVKEFYSGISDALRAYLERGFDVPALERTTNELTRDLRKRAFFNTERQAELKDVLETCDLVKFAKFRPEPGGAMSDHAAAVRFVEATRAIYRRRQEAAERGPK